MDSNKNGNKASHEDDKSAGKDPSPRWRVAEHVFAVIGAMAALIAITGTIIVGIKHTSFFEKNHEEQLVSSLIPGDDYAKMAALIGVQPDFHKNLHSGRQIYVFDRRWEYIQLLVDETGTVLSVGIYAKTTSFNPTLVTGVVVNGPPVNKQIPFFSLIGGAGSCGASYYYYYQGYSLSEAQGDRSEIIGDLPVVDTNRAQDVEPLCSVFFSNNQCILAYYKSTRSNELSLSSKLMACIEASKAGQSYLANLAPAIVIISAPQQSVLPDMVNTDYFFTLAHI